MLDSLLELEDKNPKAYWDIINKFKCSDKDISDQSSNIPSDEWYNYFNKLLNVDCSNEQDDFPTRMESALGTPLTYWDSTIDHEIEDGTQSVLWTAKYFGLRGYYNIDGYTKRIADMVQYQPHPECPTCAGSQDLYCDQSKDLCLTRRRDPNEYAGHQVENVDMAYSNRINNNGPKNIPCPIYGRDIRVRMDSVTVDYNNISITTSLEGHHQCTLVRMSLQTLH
ncbi:Hypothetical predicted protein [Mytilus galloprovincialis]|uniref:Uncharacterized protein n=1 Tax=Mytilus galloprovincialis TaxID=29158 RepID=A0A8B6FP10_MYTGA|nr:Hypothetical predicted protein [Mytilus galloprovincialis]